MSRAKSILMLSLLLNIGLGATAMVAMSRRPIQGERKAEPVRAAISVEAAPEARSKPSYDSAPLRWTEIESPDDTTYMRNLRAIGCPEVTILDLLSASIGHRYDGVRERLRDQRAQGGIDAAGFEEAIAKSWEEQNALLAKLYGRPDSYGAGGGVRMGAGQGAGVDPIALEPPVSSTNRAPVAFMEPDPSWGLSSQELAIWDQVNAQFVEAIGGPGQNPKDPAYHQRWKEAQTSADERLKMLLGDESYLKFEMRVPGYMSRPAQ